MRGQASLPSLAVALVVLTTVAGVGIALAETSFASADRDSRQRQVAVALSERLVGEESRLTARPNVLNGTAVDALTVDRLRDRYPVVGDRSVRVRLGDRTLLEAGAPTGPTIRRIVLVRREQVRTYTPAFEAENATTLPRRTDSARLRIDPPRRTRVSTVVANERVVLANSSGLRGTFRVDLSRFETTRLTFVSNRSLSRGDVRVTYYPARTTKAVLEVTVGD